MNVSFDETYQATKRYLETAHLSNRAYKIGIYTKEGAINHLPDFEMDYRLWQGKYAAFIAAAITDTAIERIIACTSVFFYIHDFFEQIHFWFHDKAEGRLKRISLNELLCDKEQYAITIGFTKILKELGTSSKYSITNMFLGLYQVLLEKDETLFIETTGYASLSADLQRQEVLGMNDLPRVGIERIGVTRELSRPVEKLAVRLGLKEQKNIYNLRTLGKVYLKRSC
ncbi:MAG: hypothetical protein A4E53_00791 [Pelotomaculum sp. PtaB.Bin104]|nr:MAG: hypothetical protein A4E53_00791 [Pelotomaculum sp. PtaB.Bin104]